MVLRREGRSDGRWRAKYRPVHRPIALKRMNLLHYEDVLKIAEAQAAECFLDGYAAQPQSAHF